MTALSLLEWKEATVLFLRKAISSNGRKLITIQAKLVDLDQWETDDTPRRIWPMLKEPERSDSSG